MARGCFLCKIQSLQQFISNLPNNANCPSILCENSGRAVKLYKYYAVYRNAELLHDDTSAYLAKLGQTASLRHGYGEVVTLTSNKACLGISLHGRCSGRCSGRRSSETLNANCTPLAIGILGSSYCYSLGVGIDLEIGCYRLVEELVRHGHGRILSYVAVCTFGIGIILLCLVHTETVNA